MPLENAGKIVEDVFEGIKNVAETPAVDHAGHQLIEQGLEKITEALDFDDDGSILDTVPDLIEAGMDLLSSIFD